MSALKIFFLIILIIATAALSQPGIVALFSPHSHTYAGTTIPYRLFIPQNLDTTRVYPLVLALHGAGERGNDNLIHIQSHRLATSWADPINQANYPCFVVAPQCPLTRSWTYAFTDPIGPELATVVDLIDSLQTVFPVDSNRLYVTGLSMGGFGTWDLIQRFPDKFAAAIPMSAGGDPSQIANISHIPIWNFHGKLDDAVPVSYSREMINALENNGKPVVYTHCKYENCSGLPDSTIAMFIESHSLHFYTEYATGGHIIWPESYDYPQLFPWVFSKYRTIRNSITLTNLNNYQTLSLIKNIDWSAINQDGSVEIWFSPDFNQSWQMVTDSAANNGSFAWNTELVEDCAFGSLKIFLKNNEGFIYGHSVSYLFAIDNAMNGIPFVKILNPEFDFGEILTTDTMILDLLLADPEQNFLITTIHYSTDDGSNFEVVNSFLSPSDSVSQIVSFPAYNMANSNTAVIKVSVNDGQNISEDQTFHFVKLSTRPSSFQATHITGTGDASVYIQIVDPAELTGDLYRLSFDDSSYSYTVYNVYNVNSSQYVVQDASELNGITEGPLFDGIRLLIRDYYPPAVNYQQTGWQNSATNLEFIIYLPTVNLGGQILYGVPYPADYQITINDGFSDTSSTAFGAPAVPMKFVVQNITENRPAEVIFLDNDNDFQISVSDELYFIESDSLGDPFLTWAIHFNTHPNLILPQAGDQFLLKTYKPVSAEDIFEFLGEMNPIISVATQPSGFKLFNNYPNPFNPVTTIEFGLSQKSQVILRIFNILGQEVTTIFSGQLLSGFHTFEFDASDLASGVYLYRLETVVPSPGSGQRFVETRKMILMR
jgi:predicted esterase